MAQEKSDPNTASTNTPTSVLPDGLEVKSTEQTFAKHLANLIDAEIERRMAVQMQAIKKTRASPVRIPIPCLASK